MIYTSKCMSCLFGCAKHKQFTKQRLKNMDIHYNILLEVCTAGKLRNQADDWRQNMKYYIPTKVYQEIDVNIGTSKEKRRNRNSGYAQKNQCTTNYSLSRQITKASYQQKQKLPRQQTLRMQKTLVLYMKLQAKQMTNQTR